MPMDARLAAMEMLVPETHDDPLMAMADLTARLLYGGRDRTEREFIVLFARAGLKHTRTLSVGATTAFLEAVPL